MRNKFFKRFILLTMAILCVFSFTACSFGETNNGKSAYEIAVEQGFSGTKDEWLESLKGADGSDGINGTNGTNGVDGINGSNGENGTNGINGTNGTNGVDGANGINGSNGDSILSLYEDYCEEKSLNPEEYTIYNFINEFMDEQTNLSNTINNTINSVVSIVVSFSSTIQYLNYSTLEVERTDVGDTVVAQSAGSGVIFGGDKSLGIAQIITNYHVCFNASTLSISIEDNILLYKKTIYNVSSIKIKLYGMEYEEYAIPATYIGGSLEYDIAVLSITSDVYKNSNAKPCIIGNSNIVNNGIQSVVIGNPLNYGIFSSIGNVSLESFKITMTAADEKTQVTARVIVTTAAINSGNSGGGIFNVAGELIGIVNAKIVASGVDGMGFAIPINVAYGVAKNILNDCNGDDLLKPDFVTDEDLGLSFAITSSKSAEENSSEIIENVCIKEETTGLALLAGIAEDDVITKIKITKNVMSRTEVVYETNITRKFMAVDALLYLEEGYTIEFYIEGSEIPKTITYSVE